MKKFLFILLAFIGLNSCNTELPFPETPGISFVGNSLAEAIQFTDTIRITIHYQDGDGDLGNSGPNDQQVQNLFFRDNRAVVPDSLKSIGFSLPNLTQATRRPSIQGKITVSLLAPPHSTWFDPQNEDDNKVVYDIYLVDRAGNVSNTIQTDTITILKQ